MHVKCNIVQITLIFFFSFITSSLFIILTISHEYVVFENTVNTVVFSETSTYV